MGRSNGPESFLACGVPDLGLDGAASAEGYSLCSEFHSDCWVLVFRQLIFDIARENVSLPNTGVPHENHYKRRLVSSVTIDLRLKRKL